MIVPTIGRVVWYRPTAFDRVTMMTFEGDQACAATVAYVWGDRLVNLTVSDHNGITHSRTSVQLVQEGDPLPTLGGYAEWMPYQMGQAKKTEAAEAAAQKR